MNRDVKIRIAAQTAKSIYETYPNLWERFGERGFLRTEEDNMHHLDHLETSFELQDQQVFIDYSKWLETVLTSRNVETALIVDNFERLIKILPGNVNDDEEEFMIACLRHANKELSAR